MWTPPKNAQHGSASFPPIHMIASAFIPPRLYQKVGATGWLGAGVPNLRVETGEEGGTR
jgi:hypothetical protein